MQLTDKVIAITGGARGLGFATAQRLGSQGARLALLDMSAEALDEAVSLLSSQRIDAQAFVVNVADEESVQTAFADIATRMGPVSGCVNNAGVTDDALLIKTKDGKVEKRMSLSSWLKVLDVNLTGVFLCGREAATQMVEAGHQGVIVNISSISRAGNMGQSNYAAAKAGIHALTVTWGKELARYGIRAGTVAPGFIATDMIDQLPEDKKEEYLNTIPLKRFGTAEEVAEMVAMLAGPACTYMTGQVIVLDGGLSL